MRRLLIPVKGSQYKKKNKSEQHCNWFHTDKFMVEYPSVDLCCHGPVCISLIKVVFSMPAAGRLTAQLACRQYYRNGNVIGCFK